MDRLIELIRDKKNPTALGLDTRLDYLPADCQLLGGDLVVTSGLGGYYPPDLSIGTVEEVQLSDSGASSYAVLVPEADFDQLVEVFVIKSFDIQT